MLSDGQLDAALIEMYIKQHNGKFTEVWHAIRRIQNDLKELVELSQQQHSNASTPLKIGNLEIAQSVVSDDFVYIGEVVGGEAGDFAKSDLAPVLEKFYREYF